MSKKPTTLSPRAAKTIKQVCRLKTDNFDAGGYWILHGTTNICFAQQKNGERATQAFTIPRKTFDRMVDWYHREQKLRGNQ